MLPKDIMQPLMSYYSDPATWCCTAGGDTESEQYSAGHFCLFSVLSTMLCHEELFVQGFNESNLSLSPNLSKYEQ